MTDKGAHRLEFGVIAFAILFAGTYLAWQATHGGVVSHHLLDDRKLPAISNWWGLAILPLIGGLASWSVRRRATANAKELAKAAAATAGALLVGAALSTSFLADGSGNAPFFIFLAVLAAGVVLPAYRAEYVFGFVIGMSYAFGLVLPSVAALVVVAISAVFRFVFRPALVWAVRRARS
jgi:hypothetical protein